MAKELVDELLETTNSYSYIILKSTVLRFVFSLSITLDSINKSGCISTTFDMNNLPELIIDLETLTDIKDTLYILIKQVIMKMDDKKKNMNSDIVEEVIEAIHIKYMDQNLTPELISETLSMSPLYLGRLFKKQTTQSIANYINDVRLANAKELLLGTEESIKDIVTLCGYSNSNYFFTLFKKTNGLTPSDFRKNHQIRGE